MDIISLIKKTVHSEFQPILLGDTPIQDGIKSFSRFKRYLFLETYCKIVDLPLGCVLALLEWDHSEEGDHCLSWYYDISEVGSDFITWLKESLDTSIFKPYLSYQDDGVTFILQLDYDETEDESRITGELFEMIEFFSSTMPVYLVDVGDDA